METIIDTHAHLDFKAFDKDRSQVLERAKENGVTRIVTIGGGEGLQSNHRALALAHEYEHIYATVGIHPHDAKIIDEHIMAELARLAREKKVVAIGEIGMDLAKKYSPPAVQKQVFRDQLALARDLDLPVVIHDREAHSEIMWVLKADGVPKAGGVMHCFSGDADLARELITLGFYISIPGVVTYKNAKTLQAVARGIPLERMLLETDCPYLTPEPHRGERNEPAYVKYTAQAIANLRGISFAQLTDQTTKNAMVIFRLAQTG